MANRRMISLDVIDTDNFLDMPISSRLLYYDLTMRADDDGFISSHKKIARMTGTSQDDLNILINKGFIIPFESGVIVITHWRMNNYIRKDRYTETLYLEEKAMLTLSEHLVYQLATSGIPTVASGKVRLGKVNNTHIYTTTDLQVPNFAIDENTKSYGKYQRIILTNSDFFELLQDNGISTLAHRIILLDEYLESNNNKNNYTNHKLLINKSFEDNWFEKEGNENGIL